MMTEHQMNMNIGLVEAPKEIASLYGECVKLCLKKSLLGAAQRDLDEWHEVVDVEIMNTKSPQMWRRIQCPTVTW